MTSVFSQSNVRTEIREFLRLAIPLASAQVAQLATGFVEWRLSSQGRSSML